MKKNWEIMKEIWDVIVDNKFIRFFCLLWAGSYWYFIDTFADVKFFRGLGIDMKVAEYLATVAVGIPVFILLWYFRTRDVRQQIDKAQGQIYQSEYADAVNNIASTDRLKIEVGVRALITLSEIAPKFNDKISSVFLERLKLFNLDESKINVSIPLTYGVEILIWLDKNVKINEVPYWYWHNPIDLSYQTFYGGHRNFNFEYIRKSLLKVKSFRYANLQGANLQNIKLINVDLTRANLGKANLCGADLTRANLGNANLYGADLTRANLGNANLCGADFTDAILTDANLLDAKTDENTKQLRN